MKSCSEFQLCGRVGEYLVVCGGIRRAWNHGLVVSPTHTLVEMVMAFILRTPTETLQSVTIAKQM